MYVVRAHQLGDEEMEAILLNVVCIQCVRISSHTHTHIRLFRDDQYESNVANIIRILVRTYMLRKYVAWEETRPRSSIARFSFTRECQLSTSNYVYTYRTVDTQRYVWICENAEDRNPNDIADSAIKQHYMYIMYVLQHFANKRNDDFVRDEYLI